MIKKIGIILGVITTIGFAGWYITGNNEGEMTSPIRDSVIQAVYATGEVEPVYWSKISTQVPGKIERIFVKEGDAVTENQPMAKLEDSVECARASEHLARLSYLEKEMKRYEALSAKEYASKSKYELIKSEHQAVKAQLEVQNEVVARMIILSPLDGVVLKRDIEPGEAVSLSDVVFWVGKLSPLRITAEVDEEDIALVQVGQKALIKADAFPDALIEGTVSEITPKGDPVDKDFRVRLALPEDTPLLVGMTVEVNIVTKTIENALIVPVTSVADDKVWVREGSKFQERKITPGITNEYQVQVLGGLEEGDMILLNAPSSGSP